MIRCVLIDDEPPALSILAEYVGKTDFLELTASFTNAVKAFEFVNQQPVDLLFIDIQMPDMTGVEFVSKLRNKPMIVFTTAFSQYAIDGFKADAIDYLLKPIDFPDFLKAANKAREWIQVKSNKTETIESNNDFLFIKSEHKIVRLNFEDILYVQGMSEYVKIYLQVGKPVMSLLSLKALEARLPEQHFMRVHKSFIVNLNKISIVERNEIYYDNGTVIPVSNQYREAFQNYLDKNFIV